MNEYKYPDGNIGPARQFVHDDLVVTKSFLIAHADSPAALAEVGCAPVRREPFDGDINTHAPGDPVQTEQDGWVVISYPNPVAKVPVWSKDTLERTLILPDEATPEGFTLSEPAYGKFSKWEDDAWECDMVMLKATMQAEIKNSAQAFLDDIAKREYPQWEIETWKDQETEAKAYQAGVDEGMTAEQLAEIETPTLDGICAGRGMDKAVLVPRVIANAAAWRPVATYVVGQRLKLKDDLDAANSYEAVMDIEVSYALPA